jgi:hypothetical protein
MQTQPGTIIRRTTGRISIDVNKEADVLDALDVDVAKNELFA